ncbi:hypothetical protein LEMA_P070860.1 [Plenodomus lingam JN3]|uniref:Sulfatase N-terminal domain-containing protein n=1 Tax=Leptosphaeria maculans (strain JN3 / isolate v23.1.3 / race Av1-4-5-6-7-8) TaxID=985895 RepID=E4ZJE7_LEPMJ|nr:hypothetical protein LEMA_P070860.1 [Plenodomus lingam JN3]CBX91578.1 hypothetical protein LEMA_P070860.1 [Plenodomus lingam JN3]
MAPSVLLELESAPTHLTKSPIKAEAGVSLEAHTHFADQLSLNASQTNSNGHAHGRNGFSNGTADRPLQAPGLVTAQSLRQQSESYASQTQVPGGRQKKPNILYIMADQMAAPLQKFNDPNSVIKTPHLDELARTGINFASAYCNSPLCAPSRFTMCTGQLPSKIGGYDNASILGPEVPTYAHYLRREGYETALAGKMHFIGPDQLHGFEHRSVQSSKLADILTDLCAPGSLLISILVT